MTTNTQTDGVADELSPSLATSSVGGQGKKTMGNKVGTVVLGTTLAFGVMDTSAAGSISSGRIVSEATDKMPVATQVETMPNNSQLSVVRSKKVTTSVAPQRKKIRGPQDQVSTQTQKPNVNKPKTKGVTSSTGKSVINLSVSPDIPETTLVISPEQRELDRIQGIYTSYSQVSYDALRALLRARADYTAILRMAIQQKNEAFILKLTTLAFDRVAVQEKTYAFYTPEHAEKEFADLLKTNPEKAAIIAELVMDASRKQLFAQKIAAAKNIAVQAAVNPPVVVNPVYLSTAKPVELPMVELPPAGDLVVSEKPPQVITPVKPTVVSTPAPVEIQVAPTSVSKTEPVKTATIITSEPVVVPQVVIQKKNTAQITTKVKATDFVINPKKVIAASEENLSEIKHIPPKLPLLATEGAAQIDSLNVSLNRKIFILTELTMNTDTAFQGTVIENFGFEQRIAMLAHGIVASRQIQALDMALVALTEIVSSRRNAKNKEDIRTIQDAKSVLNFLHAMFLTAGQSVFADQMDILSDIKIGEARQKEVCLKLTSKDKQILCYEILQGSALQNDPKMVIGNIAKQVDDTVYNKFNIVHPSIQSFYNFKKGNKTNEGNK